MWVWEKSKAAQPAAGGNESKLFLEEMREKAKQYETSVDLKKLAEDMKKKFEGAGPTIDSREASLCDDVSDERVPTLSSQDNDALNVSAIKVSRIDLTLSGRRNVEEKKEVAPPVK